MIIFTKRLTTPVVRCSDRYGFVLLADMALQSGHDSDKGWHNAVADGALQDCRIDRVNRYEYISTKAFSTPAGVLSHLGQRHMIILQRDWWFCKGGVLRGAALYAPQQSQTLKRSFVVGPIDSVLSHRRWQTGTGADNGKIDSPATVCAPLPGGASQTKLCPPR